MAKKLFTVSQIKKITGASRHSDIPVPFYYAPPFLDELRDWLQTNLSSSGGRPTIRGAEVVRKVRFSGVKWSRLKIIASHWSRGGVWVSPSQVASSILDRAISLHPQRVKGTTGVSRPGFKR